MAAGAIGKVADRPPRRCWILLAILALPGGCAPQVQDLKPGECREDRDCPQPMVCSGASDGAPGACGCDGEWLGCYVDAAGQPCACHLDGQRRRCTCLAPDPDQEAADGGATEDPTICTADGDCPGPLICREGRCACDAPTAPGAPSPHCPGPSWCGGDGRCGCVDDLQCPAPLRCLADDDGVGRCRCDPAGAACAGMVGDDGAPCECDDETGWCTADGITACEVLDVSDRNGCGGQLELGPAAAQVDEACGAGDWGRWRCAGCDAPMRCCAERATPPSCCDPASALLSCEEAELTAALTCCDAASEVIDACGACVAADSPAALSAGGRPGAPCEGGLWICVDGQAVCSPCPEGRSPHLCGGCAPTEEAEISLQISLGQACGGQSAELGYDTPCSGAIRCDGPTALRCDAPARNRCGRCGPVHLLRASVEGASAADAGCLAVDGPPTRATPAASAAAAPACACHVDGGGPSTSDALACLTPLESLSASQAELPDLLTGEPCGVCGRWVCDRVDEEDWLLCEDSPQNTCQGCGELEVVFGTPTSPDAPAQGDPCALGLTRREGTLSCGPDGRSLICTEVYLNECGGLAPLNDTREGFPCESNGCPSQYRCLPEDHPDAGATECEPQPLNDCGGCGALGGVAACRGIAGARGPFCVADLTAKVCIRDADADSHWACSARPDEEVWHPCDLDDDPGRATDDPNDANPCVPDDPCGVDTECQVTANGGRRCVQACGGVGKQCCADLTCSAGAACNGNTGRCVACGSDGDRCCDNVPLCDAGLICRVAADRCDPIPGGVEGEGEGEAGGDL